nr:probable serine/threonine-protein kinase roco5 [Procambarus clarkii]
MTSASVSITAEWGGSSESRVSRLPEPPRLFTMMLRSVARGAFCRNASLRVSSSSSEAHRASSHWSVSLVASSSKSVYLREIVWVVFVGGWLVQAALAMKTGECVESSQAGNTQVTFQNRLDFGFHMSSPAPPLAFELWIEDADHHTRKWIFKRNGINYDITTSSKKSSSILVMGKGWTNWTLTIVNKAELMLIYNNNNMAYKYGLPARPDVCLRLSLHMMQPFQHRFCYPEESNQCVITTTTSTLEMVSKTPETTTPEDTPGTTTPEATPGTTTTKATSGTTTTEATSGTTTTEATPGTTTTETPHTSKTPGAPSASKTPEILHANTSANPSKEEPLTSSPASAIRPMIPPKKAAADARNDDEPVAIRKEKELAGESTSAGHTTEGKLYVLVALLHAWLMLLA